MNGHVIGGEVEPDDNEEAKMAVVQGIDFVTLGMFIIGE